MDRQHDDVLLTVNDAAALLALKSSTLRKWILQRQVPYIRLGKRAIRIPKSWISDQIRTGRQEAIGEMVL